MMLIRLPLQPTAAAAAATMAAIAIPQHPPSHQLAVQYPGLPPGSGPTMKPPPPLTPSPLSRTLHQASAAVDHTLGSVVDERAARTASVPPTSSIKVSLY